MAPADHRGGFIPTCPQKAKHGLHIHPCFTGKQGYVFTADRRKPGGFWFVDLRQARVYWHRAPWRGGCQVVPDTGLIHYSIL